MKALTAVLILLVAGRAAAELPGVYRASVERPMDEVYVELSEALDAARFYVVFEPDMGARMARFAERWGEDYNRNELTGVRAMVFCNLWYTNAVANADPDMLAVCPLHVSLYERDGRTTVLFPRPTWSGRDSPATAVLQELEDEIVGIIESSLAP